MTTRSRQLSAEQIEDARIALARTDAAGYIEYVHGEPPARHHLEWIDAIENPPPGKPHLLIIAPPGFGKSSILMRTICRIIGETPSIHIGFLSSAYDKAAPTSQAIRDVVDLSPRYHKVFPDRHPDKSKGWEKHKWYVKRPRLDDPHATLKAAGYNGPILGDRYDWLFIDDLMTEEMANSDIMRTTARNWVRKTAMTRLIGGKPGRCVCILTVWNDEDLAAEFREDKQWRMIHMPALGYYAEDMSLWQDWVPRDFLKAEQERDPITFETIYQGNPSREEGEIVKKSYWRYVEPKDIPPKFDIVIQAWDTAFKKNKTSDFSARVTIAAYQGLFYVLDVYQEKWTFPDLCVNAREAFQNCYHPYNGTKLQVHAVVVEDAASGQSLIPVLQASMDPVIPVIASKRGDSDEISFVTSVTPYMQQGRVLLPRYNAPWTTSFTLNCGAFPGARKNDRLFAFVHGIRYFINMGGYTLSDSFVVVPSQTADVVSELMHTYQDRNRLDSDSPLGYNTGGGPSVDFGGLGLGGGGDGGWPQF